MVNGFVKFQIKCKQNTKNSENMPPGCFKWLFAINHSKFQSSGFDSMRTQWLRSIPCEIFKTLNEWLILTFMKKIFYRSPNLTHRK